MCLPGAVVASWSLTQEVEVQTLLLLIQWKHLGKLHWKKKLVLNSGHVLPAIKPDCLYQVPNKYLSLNSTRFVLFELIQQGLMNKNAGNCNSAGKT